MRGKRVWSLIVILCFFPAGCANYTGDEEDAGTDARVDGGDYSPADEPGADDFRDGVVISDRGDRHWADGGGPECPLWVSALAECSFRLFRPLTAPDRCLRTNCMEERCADDSYCMQGGSAMAGDVCVTGNCVFCWQDDQCPEGEHCRAGRCVSQSAEVCPAPGPCSRDRCRQVVVSEAVCPVCVCDSIFSIECRSDADCQVISHHPYRRCVWGRCAECRNDDDCEWGNCLPPGLCFSMRPHPEVLYGTWLLGIAAGLDHFSYFRFEPDGVLRRGHYEPQMAWSDDIPLLPCTPEGGFSWPLWGTWEPEVTESGFLVVRMSLNLSCDPADGWSARFAVEMDEDGAQAIFRDVDGDQHLQAFKVSEDRCAPDFSECELPVYP